MTKSELQRLEVGDSIPDLRLPAITRKTLAVYAGASGDHHPLHIDSDYARDAGARRTEFPSEPPHAVGRRRRRPPRQLRTMLHRQATAHAAGPAPGPCGSVPARTRCWCHSRAPGPARRRTTSSPRGVRCSSWSCAGAKEVCQNFGKPMPSAHRKPSSPAAAACRCRTCRRQRDTRPRRPRHLCLCAIR